MTSIADKIYAAVSDPSHDAHTVNSIAKHAGVSRSTAHRHARILEAQGILFREEHRRDAAGKWAADLYYFDGPAYSRPGLWTRIVENFMKRVRAVSSL